MDYQFIFLTGLLLEDARLSEDHTIQPHGARQHSKLPHPNKLPRDLQTAPLSHTLVATAKTLEERHTTQFKAQNGMRTATCCDVDKP